jgi:hypothetical protein
LIFRTSDGDQIPCSAEWVTLELMGNSAALIDPEVVQNAATAVLHYFKHELGKEFVSVAEFAVALEKALHGFGLTIYADDRPQAGTAQKKSVVNFNLQELADGVDKGFELLFFPNLREQLKNKMEQAPDVVRFHGLRGCVKQLVGTARWTRRCQNLNDQIVDYLRHCWQTDGAGRSCALIVL